MDWILHSIQTGLPRTHSDGEKSWQTGIFKQPVAGAIEAKLSGLVGDGVGDTKNHGGADKAVCCHPMQHYHYWNTYFLWDLKPGVFGENFTISGLTEIDVCVGDIWQIGNARFQVSQPRIPCWKQDNRLQQPNFQKLVRETGRTGFYLRVLQEGAVSPGDTIHLLERPHPEATIVRLNRALNERGNVKLVEEFAALAPLAESWRNMFQRQLGKVNRK